MQKNTENVEKTGKRSALRRKNRKKALLQVLHALQNNTVFWALQLVAHPDSVAAKSIQKHKEMLTSEMLPANSQQLTMHTEKKIRSL
jgi:hypothetical protein